MAARPPQRLGQTRRRLRPPLVVLAIGLVLFACSWLTVEIHQAALVWDSLLKRLRPGVLRPGRHLVGPSALPIVFDTRVFTLEFCTDCADAGDGTRGADGKQLESNATDVDVRRTRVPSLCMWTKSGQTLCMDASLMYRVVVPELPELYLKHRYQYRQQVQRVATMAIKNVAPTFETEAYFENRVVIRDAMVQALNASLRAEHIDVLAMQLRQINVSAAWEDAILRKLLSAQLDRTRRFEQQTAEIRADIGVLVGGAAVSAAVVVAARQAEAKAFVGGYAAAVSRNVSERGRGAGAARERVGFDEADLLVPRGAPSSASATTASAPTAAGAATSARSRGPRRGAGGCRRRRGRQDVARVASELCDSTGKCMVVYN